MPFLSYEYICRLDVAVNDPFAVRGIQRIGDFDAQCEQRVIIQAAVAN